MVTPRLQVGGSLTEDALYVERAADTEIFDALFRGEICYVLAPRQIGKSSLCSRAARRLRQHGVHCVHIDLNVIGGQINAPDAERWYYSLIKELSRRLSFGRNFADDFSSKHANETLAYRLKLFFREEILGRISGPIVLIFDEIDIVLSMPFPVDDFFAVVRDAYNSRSDDSEYRRITFGFVGVATPAQLMRNAARTPFNVGRGIFLDDFKRTEAVPFLTALGVTGNNESEASTLLDAVFDWTSGHPYMTHRVCAHLIEHPEGDRQKGDTVAKAVQELFLTEGQTGDTNLQYAAKRIDALHDAELLIRLLQLYRRLLDGETAQADPNDPVQAELRLCGLVRYEGGQVQIRNQIFATVYDVAWVREKELARRLDDSIERWRHAGKRPEDLLQGQALAEAWQWAQQQHSTTPEENEFLLASMSESKRRAGRRAIVAILLALVIVAASCLAIAVFWLERVRRVADAERRGLAATRRQLDEERRRLDVEKELRAVIEQRLAQEQARLAAEKQKVEAEKREKEAVSENLRIQKNAVAQAKQLATVLQQRAEIAKLAETQAQARAESERALREQTELSQLALLLQQPGKRLQALVDSIKTLDAAERQGRSPPEGLLDALMGAAGQFIYSYPLTHPDRVLAAKYSPDGQLIATGCADGKIYLWETASRKLRKVLSGHHGPVRALSFRPRPQNADSNSDFLVSGGEDGQLILWHPATGNRSQNFVGHTGPIQSVDFSSNGTYLASGSADRTAKVWSIANGTQITNLQGFKGPVVGALFAHVFDEDTLIAVDSSGHFEQWGKPLDLQKPKLLRNVTGFYKNESLHFGFNHRKLSVPQMVLLEQGQSFREISSASDKQKPNRLSFDYIFEEFTAVPATAATISGFHIRLTGYQNGLIHISGDADSRVDSVLWYLEGHKGRINEISTNADARGVITASDDRTTRVWDFENGKAEVGTLAGFLDSVFERNSASPELVSINDVQINGNRILFTKSQNFRYHPFLVKIRSGLGIYSKMPFQYDRPVTIKLLGSGAIAHISFARTQLRLPKAELLDLFGTKEALVRYLSSLELAQLLMLSPDDRYALLKTKTGIAVIDTKFKTNVKLIDNGMLGITPDSQSLLVAPVVTPTNTPTVLSLSTGLRVRALDPPTDQAKEGTSALFISFSKDGKRGLIAYSDRTVRLWDLQTGRYLATLRGHEDRVVAARFSQDGRQVTTAGRDKMVRLWQVEGGTNLFSMNTVGLVPVGLSANGDRVILNNSDHSLLIRLATPDAFYLFACRLLAEFKEHASQVELFCQRHAPSSFPTALR